MRAWRTNRLFHLALGAAALLAVIASASLAAEAIKVHVGETTTLSVDYQIKELAIGNPAVADYVVRRSTPQGSEVIINGKQAGLTNLLIWDSAGVKRDERMVQVTARDINAHLGQVKALIGRVEGVQYRVAGDKVVIEGEVKLPQDRARIAKIVAGDQQVVNLVTLSPLALKVVAESIQKDAASDNVQVRVVGQSLVISGFVYSPEESKRVEAMARLYHPEVVNVLEVRKTDLAPGKGEMVQVTAHFMEVGNTVLDGWGVNWSPGATGEASGSQGLGSGASSFTGSIVGTLTNLFPKFNQAKERGGVRNLETTSVSVRSGEDARLHSGGEMAIPTAGSSGQNTVTFKEWGVFLKVLPVAQGDKITLRINVEVSAPASTSGGYLNFSKHTLNTVQYCTSGDSVALGGLISQRDSKVFDALPAGSSGALVQLYASEDFKKSNSQLVVFITPSILGEAKEAHQDLKRQVQEKFDAYEERKR